MCSAECRPGRYASRLRAELRHSLHVSSSSSSFSRVPRLLPTPSFIWPVSRSYTVGNWTTRGYANSWIANSRTGYLADWSTRGLDNSRTSQLADWTSRGLDNSRSRMPPKERKLSTQSRWWHPRVVQSATCPVRELSSPRVDQSARCPVRESSSPRVGVSASCPVTTPSTSSSADRLSNSFITGLNSKFVMKFTLLFKVS